MNIKRFVIAGFVIGLVAFLTDGLIHQVFLADTYAGMKELVAPAEQMSKWFGLFVVGRFVFGFLLARVFIYGFSNGGVMEGLRFGLLTGLLMWIPILCVYVTFHPYPKTLDIGEPIAGVIQFLIFGVLLSMIYKPSPE